MTTTPDPRHDRDPKNERPDVVRTLKRLSHVGVEPETAAAAVDRVRARLRTDAQPARSRGLDRRTLLRQFLVAGSTAAVTAAAILPWRNRGRGSGIALAWNRIANAKTLTMNWEPIWSEPGLVTKRQRVLILADGRHRSEQADGNVWVFDFREGNEQSLHLTPDRQAFISHSVGERPQGIYSLLKQLRGKEVHPLGETQLDGQRMLRFFAEYQPFQSIVADDLLIFADPKTSLPVRIEMTNRNAETGEPLVIGVATNIAFDTPLDESLFSTDLPPGYKMITPGELAPLQQANP